MYTTGGTSTGQGPNFFTQQGQRHQPLQPAYKPKQTTSLDTFKKVIYFLHFIITAIVVTYILIRYPHAREASFTLIALIIFGYMAIWIVIINFIFLTFDKQNWAVLFDRLFIKFFIMLWPIFAGISYARNSFLNINEVAYFALYMCIVSLILIVYEIYTCTFAEHQNPAFIFQQNDLKESDQNVWNARKLYNQGMMKNSDNIRIDA